MPNNFATGTAGILSSWELNRLAAGVQGTYGWTVQSATVTWSSGLTFAYASAAAGDYTLNSVAGAAISGSTVVLSTQDPTNPRVDVIVTTVAGSVSALTGTPAALTTTSGPVPTAPTALQLEIARIFVPASGTPLSSASITDKRTPIPAPNVFDLIRTQLRATPSRRLIGEFCAGTTAYAGGAISLAGNGFIAGMVGGVASSASVQSNEAVNSLGSAGGTSGGYYFSTGGGAASVAPNRIPRLLVRAQPPASSANVTVWAAGFMTNTFDITTNSGAYLRIATTGNLFFVTRQGGTETATDLGARPAGVTTYEVETVDSGVTWVCRGATGTVLATSTTNVPTAATVLYGGVGQTTATANVISYVAYMRLEAAI